MSEKETYITLSLYGERAADYIVKRRGNLQEGDSGTFFIGTIPTNSEENFTELGPTKARRSVAVNDNNHEVILDTLWDWRGANTRHTNPRFRTRKVSVNEEGFGKQQLTKGVDLFVQTDSSQRLI